MRNFLIACVLLSAATAAFPQAKEDGSWWKSLSPAFKLGYVSGFTRRSELTSIGNEAGCLTIWSELKPVKTAYTFEQWRPLCTPKADFDGVPMGQFVDGLNSFYADYRNQKIEFGPPIEYVRDGIKGQTAIATRSRSGSSSQVLRRHVGLRIGEAVTDSL